MTERRVWTTSKLKLWKRYSGLMVNPAGAIPTSSSSSADSVPLTPDFLKKQLLDYVTYNTAEKLTKAFLDSVAAFVDEGDDADNLTPCMLAARLGHVKSMEQLIKVGRADVNKKAAWNESTAIHVAAESGEKDCVAVLLACGAQAGTVCRGKTALQAAQARGHQLCIETLRDAATAAAAAATAAAAECSAGAATGPI